MSDPLLVSDSLHNRRVLFPRFGAPRNFVVELRLIERLPDLICRKSIGAYACLDAVGFLLPWRHPATDFRDNECRACLCCNQFDQPRTLTATMQTDLSRIDIAALTQ